MLSPQRHRSAWIFTHIVGPLMLGGTVYLCWRSPDLLMFRWAEAVGMITVLNKIRLVVVHFTLPDWILYNLPDACWSYAWVAHARLVWCGSDGLGRWAWISLIPAVGIISEAGQALTIVPGTFDYLDLAAYALGAIWAMILTKPAQNPNSYKDIACTRPPSTSPL